MLDETKNRYLKLANNFYAQYMCGSVVNIDSIKEALLAHAVSFQPAYFRRLKNAIAYDLSDKGVGELGDQVLQIRNPVTVKGSELQKKPKPIRAKYFTDEDLERLARHLVTAGFAEEFAAISLIRHTGSRPAELRTMQVKKNLLFIKGAKKSNGLRGADRLLTMTDDSAQNVITDSLRILNASSKSLDAIRHRLRSEAMKLWPRRTAVPSMYSMRHQVGSNLKASSMSKEIVAYIMGHQSTNSVRRYGNKRRGDAFAMSVEPACHADLSLIRDKVKLKHPDYFKSLVFDG